jgi:tetratricopeptide (TPR) repeat protein
MAKFVDTSRLFQRASEAVEKGNYDYAISLYFDILRLTPDDVKARISLRTTEKAKFERAGHGPGTAIKAALLGWPNLFFAGLASAFGGHEAAISLYEAYLRRNPFATHTLWSLGNQFEKAGRDELAIVTYEFLRQIKPTHIKALRQLARIFVKRKDSTRAQQRYQMILQYLPHDVEASKQVRDLAATDSVKEGWETSDTFQDKIRDKEKAVRLEQKGQIIRSAEQAMDAVDRVKAELAETPDKPVLWAELGDLQRRKGDLAAAEEAYRKAIELDPKNQLYLQKLMDAQLAGHDERIEAIRAEAQAKPADKPLQDRLAQAEKEKETFWLAELKRRVEERPTDTSLRFELGQLYLKTGKINEATGEFQRVVRDAKYRLQATAFLGKCFAAKGLDELAIGQLEKALEESNLHDAAGKDIAYNLGILYEKVGNLGSAEDTYKKIFEIDIDYLDIADRMERVYKMRREKN